MQLPSYHTVKVSSVIPNTLGDPWYFIDFHWNVTFGNSPTTPSTLGSYQNLDRVRLATHAGVVTTERNHIYHLIYNIYWDFISSQHVVHGMVMVHNITSAVHQVGHLMASQNSITCQLQMSTTWTTSTAAVNYTSGHEKNKDHFKLWGLASKPITTSHYQWSITIINNYIIWSDPQQLIKSSSFKSSFN